jgi:4-amino-4-deoxy-L-arabinose transferase-like glycosyltransferase
VPDPLGPPVPQRVPSRWTGAGLTVVLGAFLFLLALPVRWEAARGDLWFDEADYALAATRGWEANRWDRTPPTDPPDHLLRLRHYHPPLGVQLMGAMLPFGRDERLLRLPSVLAGAATVALLYVCGLLLYRGRGAALAAGLLLAFNPPHIRASSHALPWVWVTLFLVALLAVALAWLRRPHPGWAAAAGAVLGGMFVASEYFVPTLAATAGAVALLAWRDRRALRQVRGWMVLLPFGAFAVVAATFWPAGLQGGVLTMLAHYVAMADDPHFPVTLGGRVFEQAPKWAYLYWYWRLYPGLVVLWAVGGVWAGYLAFRRRLGWEGAAVLGLAAFVLAVAHASHIIGPQYLAHAVPLLLLIGLLAPAALPAAFGRPGHLGIAACCAALLSAPEVQPLAGMEPRALQPRWPAALAHLRGEWQPGDRMLASGYGVAARWSVVHVGRLPAAESDIRSLPAEAKRELLWELRAGKHRWVLAGNSLGDWTEVDNRIRLELGHWRVAWRSPEPEGLPSRLTLYEFRPREGARRLGRRAALEAARRPVGP